MSAPEANPKFEALLEYLQRSRSFDFTGYKRASLIRRVDRRLETIGVRDYAHYMDYLEVHPEEFAQLFNTILINVTDFFRDPPAWEYLAGQVIPNLLQVNPGPIRVWCAGVASGEEAYTVAMVLAEALGEEAFLNRAKIYATDVDEEALSQARQAIYGAVRLQEISPERRERFFEELGGRYVFRPALRRAVIFGRHDLLQDAPISRLDLLICRNTLMYFNLEAQSRILARFHFALKDAGVLFLGRAEMLLTHSSLFKPIDLRQRIFSKIQDPQAKEFGWAARIRPEDRERVLATWDKSRSSGSQWSEEFEIVGARTEVPIHLGDGVHFCDLTVEPLHSAQNMIAGITCTFADLTASRRERE